MNKPTPKNPRALRLGRPVSIVGTGSYLPELVLTNADLEKMVDTSDEWIVTRTGIRERRIAPAGVCTSDLGARASLKALEDACVAPEEVELIIVGTSTPDMLFPSTGALIQQKIGAKRAACFDMEAACAGFLYAMEVGCQFVSSGTYDTVLAIGAEKLTAVTDWKDRSTCVLFGDGAGAVVLKPGDHKHTLWFTCMGTDGSQADLICMPGGGALQPATHESVEARLHYLKMQGPEVFKQAVLAMGRAALEAMAHCGLTADDIACVIPHQANMRIIKALAERLEIPLSKFEVTIDKYGNMSAASVIIAMDEAARRGRLKKGDLVLLVAFGSGLTWAASVIQW